MRIRTSIAAIAVGAALAAVGSAAVQAESMRTVETTIQDRQAIMKSVGTHFGAIKAAVQGGNVEPVPGHAQAIAGLAAAFLHQFPEGSGPDSGVKTRALAKIWEDWDGFTSAGETVVEKANVLASTAESGDVQATAAAFGDMGKNGCGNCHGTFRAKEE